MGSVEKFFLNGRDPFHGLGRTGWKGQKTLGQDGQGGRSSTKGAGGRASYLNYALIGLARMLWVDPEWPVKACKGQDTSILKCSAKCDACTKLVMQGKPALCPKWKKEKRAAYRVLFL